MKRVNTAVWLENQNRWQIKVQKDGQRRTFTSSKPGRTGQREANAKADAWLDDNITDENQRISALFAEYANGVKNTTSTTNWRQIDSMGRCYILPQIGHIKIGRLTEQHLQNIINYGFGKGLSKKTLQTLRSIITSFLKYCRKRKATTLLPESLVIPKGAREKGKHILQLNEFAKLFSSDKTIYRGKEIVDPYINAYRFQVLTGLRPGELLGLEWGDIDRNTVYIKRSINRENEVTTGKNENAIRCFALSQAAKTALDDQRKINPTGRVFGDLTQDTYRTRWQAYCAYNGIQILTPYELRHTFVSVAKTLPEGEVKAVVGHSRNMDTFGTYGHEIEGDREKTAQKIGDAFDAIFNKAQVG